MIFGLELCTSLKTTTLHKVLRGIARTVPGPSRMSDDTELPATSCYLDEKAFRRSCEVFLEHSHFLNDGWTWEEVSVCFK